MANDFLLLGVRADPDSDPDSDDVLVRVRPVRGGHAVEIPMSIEDCLGMLAETAERVDESGRNARELLDRIR
jgi:hypothetical protein